MTETISTTDSLPVELGWGISTATGWGLFALHVALGLAREGRRVHVLARSDLSGVPATLLPTLAPMLEPGDVSERRIRIEGYGNHWPAFVDVPNRVRVLLAVFEDTAIPVHAVDDLKRYDLILTPSTWAQGVLKAKGIHSTVWHQGYDDTLFTPAPRRRPKDGRFYVFSGGKLEFRKGQDIVVEAFRRFRETPEGRDAVLVTAWQNRWPPTMHSIWESGYVKGVPVIRDGRADITAWLAANGIPPDATMDLGFLSQEQFASAIRECDVALFPNRCEGATNMVLPEVMGSGVPCIASQNTGHLDVFGSIDPDLQLTHQSPVTLPCPLFTGMDGWGESDPEECVNALQRVRQRALPPIVIAGAQLGAAERAFAWSTQALWLDILLSSADSLAHA